MKRESWKIFIACAIGAGIGSLVALEMSKMFWWIGLVVGGLTGYMSYEWRAVLRAIPSAYHAARGWHAPEGYWSQLWYLFIVSFSTICWTVGLLTLFVGRATDWSTTEMIKLAHGSAGMLSVIPLLVLGSAIATRNQPAEKACICAFRQVSYAIFPPILFFWHLPRGIWWVTKRLPRVMVATLVGVARGVIALVRFTRRFSWQLFLRIHSEMRLLCGIDAMLGAGVGYFAGSALVGALAGGIFGILNHAVVTERWLKPRGYLPIK